MHAARAASGTTWSCRKSRAFSLLLGSLAWSSLSGIAACKRETVPQETAASGQHYHHLFGQRYRTLVDLYLFADAEDPEYRYLGVRDGGTPAPASLPATVSVGNVGRTFGGMRIVDTVPAGSELIINAETHEVTDESGIREKGGYPMGFICALAYRGRRENGILAEFIQSGRAAPAGTPNQEIDPRIAARISD